MVKNWLSSRFALSGLGLALLPGCAKADETPPGYQGVVEFDERDLAFEVAGRLRERRVGWGSVVEESAEIGRLDDEIERASLSARDHEAKAAEEQVALLRAGARPEDIRAARAQVRSIRAREELLRRNVERETKLLREGATTRAVVDDVSSRLAGTIAEREAAEQHVRLLERGARPEEIASAAARAEAAAAASALERERVRLHVLRAPISGTVTDVYVEPGEVVAAGAPIVTIADTKHPYADVFVPQQAMAGIVVGQPAHAVTDANRRGVSGRVERVAQRVEFTPRFLFSPDERANLVLRVRVRLDATKEPMPAGVPVFVTIERGSGK